MKRSFLAFCLLAAISLPRASAVAQSGPYPALQPSRVATREYNFAVSDFDGGTALVAQWREGLGDPRYQFTAEAGLADGAGSSALLLGGGVHYQLARATDELPLDMVLGGGVGLMLGSKASTIRIPFGVVLGHRFPLEQEFAITPFLHPRISLDRTTVDTPGGGNSSNTETNIDIDIGGSFEINPQMHVRMAATLGERGAVGLSFAWMPRGLR